MGDTAVYLGAGSYAFYKTETDWNNVGAMGNGSSQKHIPFNRMIGFTPPEPKGSERVIYLWSSKLPQIIYTPFIRPGEAEVAGFYKDPFLLLRVFPNKSINAGGAWTATNDVITADFLSDADKETIAIQEHIHETLNTDNIDNTYKGCDIIRYGWFIEKGGYMMERATIKCPTVVAATQVPDIDAGFDGGEFNRTGVDGGFSNWDGEIISKGVHAKDIVLTLGVSALAGLSVENFSLVLEIGKEHQHIQESQTAKIRWETVQAWQLNVDGFLKTDAHMLEARKTFANKTPATVKIAYDPAKYLQFTQGYIVSAEFETIGIPEAGMAARSRFTIRGGVNSAMSFSWTGDEATDPSSMFKHDN